MQRDRFRASEQCLVRTSFFSILPQRADDAEWQQDILSRIEPDNGIHPGRGWPAQKGDEPNASEGLGPPRRFPVPHAQQPEARSRRLHAIFDHDAQRLREEKRDVTGVAERKGARGAAVSGDGAEHVGEAGEKKGQGEMCVAGQESVLREAEDGFGQEGCNWCQGTTEVLMPECAMGRQDVSRMKMIAD